MSLIAYEIIKEKIIWYENMTKPIIKYSLLGMILSAIGCCNTTKYIAVNEEGNKSIYYS